MPETLASSQVARMFRNRLAKEFINLDEALASGQPASILDKLADIQYYVLKLATHGGIGAGVLQSYADEKSAYRASGLRCVALERRIALELVYS